MEDSVEPSQIEDKSSDRKVVEVGKGDELDTPITGMGNKVVKRIKASVYGNRYEALYREQIK